MQCNFAIVVAARLSSLKVPFGAVLTQILAARSCSNPYDDCVCGFLVGYVDGVQDRVESKIIIRHIASFIPPKNACSAEELWVEECNEIVACRACSTGGEELRDIAAVKDSKSGCSARLIHGFR